MGISPRYARLILSELSQSELSQSELSKEQRKEQPTVTLANQTARGPMAALRQMWRDLPTEFSQAAEAQAACKLMRDFAIQLRKRLAPDVRDLEIKGIHKGSQPFVLWKNDQYAACRQIANRKSIKNSVPSTGESAPVDSALEQAITAALLVPEEAGQLPLYEKQVDRFCRVFPDAFCVSERGRDYLGTPKAEQEKGRLLSAGFHSMMGYYRDDQPLMNLLLNPNEQERLDRLWQELDFVTSAPMRQYVGFVWFERTDSNTMRGEEFDFARAEDKAVTTPEMIERLATVYLAKADRLGVGEIPRFAIAEYFRKINRQIQQVEQSRRLAEPHHLDALIRFANRAYRRDLSSSEKADLRSFYDQLRTVDQLSHEQAVQDVLVFILMSPEFSYRVDLASRASGRGPLTDQELASRLSFFLWSSVPDSELRELARQGRLSDPQVLRSQVRRMINDDRIGRLATEFGGQWLDFRQFQQHNSVDRELFPSFNDDLRTAMFEEPIRFLEYIIKQDRSMLDCLYGDYTLVNGALATHYGLPASSNPLDWRLASDARLVSRGGLLTMSVFLTQNAPGRRTSPVKRGYWVARRLLGERIPPPPPKVPELPNDESQLGSMTLRETLAKHREHESCAGCHNRFDSLGLVFENYGAVGQLRDKDMAGNSIDTRATFPSGQDGTGVEGLQRYLKEHRQAEFVENAVRKMLSFAFGRTLLLSDEPLVAELQLHLAHNDYRFGSLLEAIVLSPQFLNKRGTSEAVSE